MSKYPLQYIVTFVVFMAIDAVWLLFIAKGLYAKHLGYIMASKPNLVAALAFYLIYILALTYFVIHPALGTGASLSETAFRAALFGLVCYATYDLTNMATVRDWPALITAIDLAWGTFVTTAVSVVSVVILAKL